MLVLSMKEREHQKRESEVKPITVELPNEQAQEAVFQAIGRELGTHTGLQVSNALPPHMIERLDILRDLFSRLAANLGKELSDGEKLFLGVTKDISAEKLQKFAKESDLHNSYPVYARYFLKQQEQKKRL